MYKFLKKFNNCSLADFAGKESFFIVLRNKKEKIQKLQHLTHGFSLIWESPESNVFSGIVLNNEIKYSTLDGRLISRKLGSKNLVNQIEHLQSGIMFGKWVWNNKVICTDINRQYHLIDLVNMKDITNFNINIEEKPISHFYQNKFIVRSNSEGAHFPDILEVFDINFQLIWQYNFSEECRFINYDKIDRDENELLPGQIDYITPYGEDKIIVSCKWSKTFCIELATGKILWENMYTGNREYIIIDDIGFVYTNGGSINKIDLKTGESLHSDKRFHLLPEMPYYNDLHISTATNGMVYHDGLLWARIYSNGYSFIVAINPYDYHYEWIHRVETKEKVMNIRFHDNRMYLHTSGSELYIYEKIE